MKEVLHKHIEAISNDLISLADYIFDHPEYGCEEYKSSEALCNYLSSNNFKVTRNVGTLDTAFRAEYQSLYGGPSIGLLCEYDALFGLGHACGHHMQGPCAVGAAVALKDQLGGKYPFKLIVYGCPDEEGHSCGGKVTMIENGCFNDIDIAMIMHGGTETTTDLRTLAAVHYKAVFSGKQDDKNPDEYKSYSGLDTMLLAFQGVEFLREHIVDDARIHYTCSQSKEGPDQDYTAEFSVRAKSVVYLEELKKRFEDVINGAAMMCSSTVKIIEGRQYDPKIPVQVLVDSFYNNAKLTGAQRIEGARKRVGSSDFGNVSYKLPGIGIRIAFAPKETSVHSREWLALGKTESAHNAVVTGAKTLASMAFDFISNPELIDRAKKEHEDAVNDVNGNVSAVLSEKRVKKDCSSKLPFNIEGFDGSVIIEASFAGKSAHAAAAPDLSRSAFDALIIAIEGVEFMRKHFADYADIHYSILSAGGTPCNVVPDNARGRFELRIRKNAMLKSCVEMLREIIMGAALMTGTTCEINIAKSDN